MVAAADGASSVHVSGTGTTQQNGPMESLDMTLTRAGGFSGTIRQGHQSLTVVSTGSTAYVKISRTFLRQARLPVSACARVCGKWIKLPAGSAQALTGAISMDKFFGSMNTNATLRYAGTAIINGTPAWKLVDVTTGVAATWPGRVRRTRCVSCPHGGSRVSSTSPSGIPPSSCHRRRAARWLPSAR